MRVFVISSGFVIHRVFLQLIFPAFRIIVKPRFVFRQNSRILLDKGDKFKSQRTDLPPAI